MKKLWIVFLFLFRFGFSGEIDIDIDREAQAFFAARDYSKAESLYEEMLRNSGSSWQRARLLYDSGTVRLALSKPVEAFEFFRRVSPNELHLLRYRRNLSFNEGIALIRQSALSEKYGNDFSFLRRMLLHKGFRSIENAAATEEVLRKREEESPRFFSPSELIEKGLIFAENERIAIHDRLTSSFLKSPSTDRIASIEYFLGNLLDRIGRVLSENHEKLDVQSTCAYFLQQSETGMPLWDHAIEPSSSNKKDFDRAFALFIRGTDALKNRNLSFGEKFFIESEGVLKASFALSFSDKARLKTRYELLLFAQTLLPDDVKNLIAEIDASRSPSSENKSSEAMKTDLEICLDKLAKNLPEEAFYYFLDGFNFREFVRSEGDLPREILTNLLEEVKIVFRLTLILQSTSEEFRNDSDPRKRLRERLKEILATVKPFISSLIKEQQLSYSHSPDLAIACRRMSWDKIIAFFEQGVASCERASKLASSSDLSFDRLLSEEMHTIRKWQKVLDLLESPPPQNSESNAEEESSAKEMQENFRVIQEMYSEDRTQKERFVEESDTW